MASNYSDVSKSLNDLLSKEYPVGSSKLELNTTTENNVKFTALSTKDNKTGTISSEIKAKYVDFSRGLALTQSWNSIDVIGIVVESTDLFCRGSKLELNTNMVPSTGQRNVKATAEYKQPALFTRATIDLFKGPHLNADAVYKHTSGFTFGSEVGYDIREGKVSKINAVGGYSAYDYSVTLGA